MRTFALVLSPIALAMLAACGGNDPVTPAPAPVVVVQPAPQAAPATVVLPAPTAISALRAGYGHVESITALPTSAAAGGQTQRRIGIKMGDGTMQYVDTPASGLSVGDRVELTADGRIRHPA